jgi:hypothetical protein
VKAVCQLRDAAHGAVKRQRRSGSYDRVNIVMLSICGVAVGYFWYRMMRRQFQRMGMLSCDGH